MGVELCVTVGSEVAVVLAVMVAVGKGVSVGGFAATVAIAVIVAVAGGLLGVDCGVNKLKVGGVIAVSVATDCTDSTATGSVSSPSTGKAQAESTDRVKQRPNINNSCFIISYKAPSSDE